ncbi:Retrovirus-related polyprotein from transposon [Salix suchowensis]|nr:Retrovirus-related polyprotein from transposon [Salix suchowensis]
MKTGETVNEFFGRTLTIANKRRINGDKLTDVEVIEKILRSMTPKYDYVVCSIEESKDLDILSIDELQSSLLVHEQRMVGHVMEEQALKVSYEENYDGRGRGNILIVCLYVDDLIYTGNDECMFTKFKQSMMNEFEMTDLGSVCWSSKKQPVVSLSTTEAEFIAAASCACQATWLRRIMKELGQAQVDPTTIFCDNNSAIKLSKNPVMHGRSKHIDVRFYFLRELTKDGTMQLVYCNTKEQIADILTKPLKTDAFLKLRELMGLCLEPIVN